jgi:hypothetical protein
MVGTGMYGAAWRRRLASGVGISRGTLWSIMRGANRHSRDIDGAMIDLIDRERDATAERGMMLTKLRNRLIDLVGGAQKEERGAA